MLPQGWMSKRCRRWLRASGQGVAQDGIVVEVGSWRGRSTTVLAAALPTRGKLYAIDTWAGTPDDPTQHDRLYAEAADVFADFCSNLRPQIRAGRVVPLRMDSLKGAAELVGRHGVGFADLVFIDADHRYEAIRADLLAYLPLVKPGGIISGHDFSPATWPGVVRAVTELLPEHRIVPDTTIWWVRR